jgi:hypothetical protein
MAPLALTQAQLEQVMRVAQPIPPDLREEVAPTCSRRHAKHGSSRVMLCGRLIVPWLERKRCSKAPIGG